MIFKIVIWDNKKEPDLFLKVNKKPLKGIPLTIKGSV